MTSRADLDAYVESQRDVRALVLRDLATWWGALDLSDPIAVKAEAQAFLPTLIADYGEVSAVLAADFYDDMRAQSGARGRFDALMADGPDAEVVVSRASWAVQPMFGEAKPDEALSRLGASADEMAMQVGKETLMRSGERDPARPRWARVPTGKTCAWCLMLASRGPVYRSAASAGDGRKFHDHDDCQPVMSWHRGRDLPEDYDEAGLYDLYARARKAAQSDDPKRILAALRRLDGGAHVTDGVRPRT